MKTNYFFGIAFLGLLSAATIVAMDCPIDDGAITTEERLPGSAVERAVFLEEQLLNGRFQRSQSQFLERTLDELYFAGNEEKCIRLRIAQLENEAEQRRQEIINKQRTAEQNK